MPSSHDQNFKNLILDYPRQAIELFAPDEAEELSAPGVRYLPVREEQLKERLGERFRELDTPVLVEWPDRRREALLFLFEEETNTRRFSLHRLAHYCLDIAELLGTERQLKYLDFVDIYAHLSEEERMIYQQEHAPEAAAISGFAERFLRQGEAIGEARGEARLLRQLLTKRFGEPSEPIEQRIASADADTLALWFDRALEARALDDIFRD
ncbi:MAG: hypothetical protein VBE63_25305 [Lamprobacter sp.]|uniref:hypothetical protein n=1 Tax=Lamprobacter sp. TaxID=3100796 RepID=UPI002B25978D|nr:hypothetical protein [Lamprobacter sp.]MEA3643228.1 hypothetical protein [Lamprobacter sp.]